MYLHSTNTMRSKGKYTFNTEHLKQTFFSLTHAFYFCTDIFNSCPTTLCGINTDNFSASMIFALKKNS